MPLTPKAQKSLIIAILLLAFAAIKLAMIYFIFPEKQSDSIQLHCNILNQPCTFATNAQFRIENLTQHNQPFHIYIDGLPDEVQEVLVFFTMKGMDMGQVPYRLKKNQQNQWYLNNAYLPACSQNRNDWQVRWQVDGKSYQSSFQTP